MLAVGLALLMAATPSSARRPGNAATDAGVEATGAEGGFRWELPNKIVRQIEVPETFLSNGVPNRFHVVNVELPWQEVQAHFLRSFERQGLYIPPGRHQLELKGQAMLTALDPQRKISYSVILHPHESTKTTVIMGEAYLGLARPPGAPDFAPVFPGAANVFTTYQEGAATVAYTAEAKPEEVQRFYAETLKKGGYEQEPDGTWKKGTQLLSFAVEALKTGSGSSVSVLVRGLGGHRPAATQ